MITKVQKCIFCRRMMVIIAVKHRLNIKLECIRIIMSGFRPDTGAEKICIKHDFIQRNGVEGTDPGNLFPG